MFLHLKELERHQTEKGSSILSNNTEFNNVKFCNMIVLASNN